MGSISHHDPVEKLLARLPDARPVGTGWAARCPAHEDRQASLSVSRGDDGRALVHCHAGCGVEAVVAAVGLKLSDLMVSGMNGAVKPHRNGKPKPPPKTFPTADAAVVALERQHGVSSARWGYQDAGGELVGVVVRWDGPNGKTIRPVARHPDGWRIAGMPVPRPLYRLPDLVVPERVYIVEGEKAAEATRSIGLTATTSSQGADSAAKTDWSPLAGKEVVILPDNDDAGLKYASDVAVILKKLEPPAAVKIVTLPNLPEGGDMADWLDSRDGAEPDELLRQVEALADVAEADPFASPARVGTWTPPSICIAELEAKPVDWLWQDYLPAGMLALIDGDPGLGKSFLTIDLAARVSRGLPMPPHGGAHFTKPAGVLLCNAEDDPARTMRPRLEAAGADLDRIHLPDLKDDEGQARPVVLPEDLPALEKIITVRDVRLVVIDPLMAFLAGAVDSHKDADIRRVLHRLKELAERTRAAIVIVRHLNKMVSVGEPMYRGGGSIGIIGAARSAFLIGRHPQEEGQRVLARIKGNLCPEPPALAFTIDAGRLGWIGEVDLKAEDLMGRRAGGGRPADAIEKAKTFLADALANGERLAREVEAEAKGQGITISTLKAAKREQGIVALAPVAKGGPWTWRLPKSAAQECGASPTRVTDRLDLTAPKPSETLETRTAGEECLETPACPAILPADLNGKAKRKGKAKP